jgi:hypothetical protein
VERFLLGVLHHLFAVERCLLLQRHHDVPEGELLFHLYSSATGISRDI